MPLFCHCFATVFPDRMQRKKPAAMTNDRLNSKGDFMKRTYWNTKMGTWKILERRATSTLELLIVYHTHLELSSNCQQRLPKCLQRCQRFLLNIDKKLHFPFSFATLSPTLSSVLSTFNVTLSVLDAVLAACFSLSITFRCSSM